MTSRSVAGAITALMIALVTPGSAWAQPTSAFVPAEVGIPAIGVTAAIDPVGTVLAPAPFLGGRMVSTFAVPPDASSVGWWADGPLVGDQGMAVLLGHNQVGGYAVFNRLGDLQPGDHVTVTGPAIDEQADFRITAVVPGIPKSDPEALRRVLSDNAPSAQLALITCGGDFNSGYRASADNVVAFAART